MVNTKLDIPICGPTSVFHFDPHPYLWLGDFQIAMGQIVGDAGGGVTCTYIWVNDKTHWDHGLYMGNHPQMAELFRLVKYYDIFMGYKVGPPSYKMVYKPHEY